MSFAIPAASTSTMAPNLSFSPNPQFKIPPFSLSLNHTVTSPKLLLCRAAAGNQRQHKSKPTINNKKKRKKTTKNTSNNNSNSSNGDVVSKGFGRGVNVDDIHLQRYEEEEREGDGEGEGEGSPSAYLPLPLPKPPAGFVVDDQGRLLLVSDRRVATIVDITSNMPLDCIIRRVFRSSRGEECMLLCPVDTPVQILKSTNFDGWSAVSDEEVESILPAAAYALAKIHMHLVYSGFCYTARGGFCYTEDDIFEFRTDSGEDVDGLPTEGVEITCFHLDDSHYMIYTPSDPLLFVAMKDHNGQLRIADDEVLEDPATISAIDEETEFNALVEEEAALLESLLGGR